MLKILQKERKSVFSRRWKDIIKAASLIYEVMHAENANSDTSEVGAIQAPDVVREELARAALLSSATRRNLSLNMQHIHIR